MSVEDAIAAAVEARLRPVLERVLSKVAQIEASTVAADGYLSTAKAAELAEVHPDTIVAWVKAGKLPEHRAGRELRVRRDELHRFMAVSRSRTDDESAEDESSRILERRRREG